MDFREPGIVDLQDEAGVNDRLVFGPQSVANRLQVFFVAAVVLVGANAARGHRRHESFLDFQPGERRLEILNVFPDRVLPSIADRRGANERSTRRNASAHHAPAEVLLIVFREGGHFRGPLLPPATLWALRFKAAETLTHVREESRLSLLAVCDNVNPALVLLADNLSDCGLNPLRVGALVIRLAVEFRLHHVEQVLRTRQTATVGDENPIRTPFHDCLPVSMSIEKKPSDLTLAKIALSSTRNGSL
jgi:hypothetical protein